jgi:hypothetical protein
VPESELRDVVGSQEGRTKVGLEMWLEESAGAGQEERNSPESGWGTGGGLEGF